ncbi:MAG: hypothetical protein HC849_04820 [Oscillatoriales cyanobacterium RU_3_3]|nr:hypothetical protein [Oscillatoriales cyanobacterium RU_3_3]NJR23853.1 hypothetical protein [Richelia sp. CSU_2_1]
MVEFQMVTHDRPSIEVGRSRDRSIAGCIPAAALTATAEIALDRACAICYWGPTCSSL